MKYNYQYDLLIVSTEKMNLINRLTHEKVKGEITLHKLFNRTQVTVNKGRYAYRLVGEYNNLFGLYDSSTGDYYRFDDWRESVKAYKTCVQYRYKGEGYYRFLKRIGYARDKQYIKKIKQITKQ